MANAHITAALRCSKFKGTTRLVLLVLADAASPGPKGKEDKKKVLPLGYCKRRLATIMALVNSRRQQTISSTISELKDAGAIKQWLRKKDGTWQVPLYFVDLDWLKMNAYTDDELEQFGYTDKRKPTNGEDSEIPGNAVKPHVSHTSATGETLGTPAESLPAGDPPYASGNDALEQPYEQRKPYNGEQRKAANGEQRKPLSPHNGKRLTDFPPCSTSGEGVFPPTDVGSFPTASRDKAHDASDHFVETPSVRPGEPGPVAPTSLVDLQDPLTTNPVHTAPPAQPVEIPVRPALPHRWPPRRECTGETLCLRPGCGVTFNDWRYLKEECQGEEDSAHA